MIHIRTATQDDIDTLYKLIIGIAKHHQQEQYVATSPQELLEAGFGDNPQFGVLLAEVDTETAGYLSYTWNYSIWGGGNYMNMDDLFVWEKYRGMKIGEKLMMAAQQVCQARGVSKIRWEVEADNTGAIRFYERLGAEVATKGLCKWNFEA